MSEGLRGEPEAILYQCHLVGGPDDGTVTNCFRPYFWLKMPGGLYEAKKHDTQDDYVQWVDDGTRRIDLYFQPTIQNEQ